MDESEIKILLEIKNSLLQQIRTKEDLITITQKELEEISHQIDLLNRLISDGSFKTAASYFDAETAAKRSMSSENIKMTKKIFTKDAKLLVDLKYSNDTIDIRFPNPEFVYLTQESYIEKIVKPFLVDLKNIELDLQTEIKKVDLEVDTVISMITLRNVKNFESFNQIFEVFQKLFVIS